MKGSSRSKSFSSEIERDGPLSYIDVCVSRIWRGRRRFERDNPAAGGIGRWEEEGLWKWVGEEKGLRRPRFDLTNSENHQDCFNFRS